MAKIEELVTKAQEISSDAERVTEAKLRKVTLPQGAGVMGLITLDNGEDHTKPNTFGPRGLISLNTAIDAALADDEVVALGVTGKPFILAAGADLTSVAGGGPDGVRVIAQLGPEKAVTLILENPLNNGKTLGGKAAYELGLADACFSGADYLEQSLLWAADVLTGAVTVERATIDRGEPWDAAVAKGAHVAESKTGGASPAARKAVELIDAARDGDRDAGFAREDDALEAMSRTPELIASLYAFDLVQKRAKRPAGAPDKSLARPVTKVGIVGAGLMASQLALLFVRRLEVPVVLTDLDQERVEKGVSYVHAEIDKLLAKGRINSDVANRHKALVSGAVDKSEVFADADFVIEAVFEEMSVKKSVFADVEKAVSPECILATNTSSLSITEMAADLEHPERVVGFHFFNPVAVMPLLEIVRGEQTDDATLATAFATGKALKKTTILVKDSPSFIVNRLLGRFMSEVGRIVDEGTSVGVADSAFAGIAPMPPHQLLGLVGPAIALHNVETLKGAFPDRFYVSPALERVVAAGKTSVYAPDFSIDPEVTEIFRPPADGTALSAS